ncbi:MAG: hypothetical protein ACTS22_01565 [Phycisphaerales bacterium]
MPGLAARLHLALAITLAGCAAPVAPVLDQRELPSPAITSQRPATAVLSSEPWRYRDAEGRVIRTRSYRLFTTTSRPLLLSRTPDFLEAALTHYRSSLAQLPEPPAKLDTYLMQSRPEWASLTRALMRENAPLYLRIQRGGFAAAGRGIYRDLGDLNDTLNLAAHEGWHQYTQLTFTRRLPVYLEEGIATYMEGFKWDPDEPDRPIFLPWANLERFRALRAAHAAGRLMPLDQLITTSPQSLIATDQDAALVWYAQVWALVHFLNEGEAGSLRPGLERLLQDAAGATSQPAQPIQRADRAGRGVIAPDPFEAYWNRSAAQLSDAYLRFIGRVVAPGAQNDIAAGRSPI